VHLVIVDYRPELRAALLGRVREAVRQTGVRKFQSHEVDRFHLDRFDWKLSTGVIIGTGCSGELVQTVNDIRAKFPQGPIIVVLKKEHYQAQAAELKIQHGISAIVEGDLAQIVNFVVECNRTQEENHQRIKNRGIVGLVHFKGGVGCSSLAIALGACWARHGMQVALVDFDDVTPHVTSWSQAEAPHRSAVSEFIRLGEVPVGRLNEALYPIEGYQNQFCVVPQPEQYGDGFHFKSNAIAGAPNIRLYIESLFQELQREFDVVVVDIGRSWGIATFVCLALCQRVLLVSDDNSRAMFQTFQSCDRIIRESNNDTLLGIKNWNVVINSFTGLSVLPKEFKNNMDRLDIFSPSTNLYVIPYSKTGRFWGSPGQTLYELSDERTKSKIEDVAFSCASFTRQAKKNSILDRLKSVLEK
jgi:cellulose biosynthesis protein BcsQ